MWHRLVSKPQTRSELEQNFEAQHRESPERYLSRTADTPRTTEAQPCARIAEMDETRRLVCTFEPEEMQHMARTSGGSLETQCLTRAIKSLEKQLWERNNGLLERRHPARTDGTERRIILRAPQGWRRRST
eukprot:GHVU01166936.1.p1 GENE.GHVU01166936.1~~GHVU01166936.1.p1  ORF type:complete len:131 (-),score=16.10 GHVU01166936.1:301-693(-)